MHRSLFVCAYVGHLQRADLEHKFEKKLAALLELEGFRNLLGILRHEAPEASNASLISVSLLVYRSYCLLVDRSFWKGASCVLLSQSTNARLQAKPHFIVQYSTPFTGPDMKQFYCQYILVQHRAVCDCQGIFLLCVLLVQNNIAKCDGF